MKVTDRIRADHRAMEPLVERTFREASKEAGPSAAWVAQRARELEPLVHRHADLETRFCFALLPQDERWVIHVTNEHGEIGRLLEAAKAGNRACLRHLANLLLGHFDEEEKYVLPLADRTLHPDASRALAMAWDADAR